MFDFNSKIVWAIFGLVAVSPATVLATEPFDLKGENNHRFSPWVQIDYLLLNTAAMELPALVTGNPIGTPTNEAGVIGAPSTSILFGNDSPENSVRSGIRYRMGTWIGASRRFGFEGEFFALADSDDTHTFGPGNASIIGRPFINLAPAAGPIRYDSQLVNSPAANISGNVSVATSTELFGTAARLRLNLWRIDPAAYNCAGALGAAQLLSNGNFGADRCAWYTDITIGHRYMSLQDKLHIHESVSAAPAAGPAFQFLVDDRFTTENGFNGLEFGFEAGVAYEFLRLDIFARLAAGATNSTVDISGATSFNGATQPGGILAQASNIGTYEELNASFITELGFNLNVHLHKRLSANVGYTMMYWSNVARAGDQIDLAVNPDLFPPAIAPLGTIGSQPTGRMRDFFAHGLTAGLAYQF